RERDDEARAGWRVAGVDVRAAAVPYGDLAHDREPESCAGARSAALERLEDALDFGHRHARAVVLDDDLPAIATARDHDVDRASRRCVLQRVAEQVIDRLA